MTKVVISLILLLSISFSLQSVTVIAPNSLKDSITKLTKKQPGEMKVRIGNFGEIPYGKSIYGYAYSMFPYKPESNDWCDPAVFSYIPIDFSSLNFELNNSPIVIANALNCSFTQKALNAQRAKGVALIIISNDNYFAETLNVDDTEGKQITIPTMIVNAATGAILTDYLRENNNLGTFARITLSLSFKSNIENDKLNMKMYFRSDQVKALHFFKEFEQYAQKLGDQLVFRPVYKYTECTFCDSNDKLEDEPVDNCFLQGKYCGGYSSDLNIENSRMVLLENLRQKCIFTSYPLATYWKYMVRFSDTCADLSLPLFDRNCSNDIMSTSQISKEVVEACMSKALSDPESKLLSEDVSDFEEAKIHRYPGITINKVKYKGSWLAQHVFHSICEGFLMNHYVCKPDEVSQYSESESDGISVWGIAFIVVGVIFTMLIIILCYRRIVNKAIDETIEDRIYRQTQDSVGNYSKMDKSGILG